MCVLDISLINLNIPGKTILSLLLTLHTKTNNMDFRRSMYMNSKFYEVIQKALGSESLNVQAVS